MRQEESQLTADVVIDIAERSSASGQQSEYSRRKRWFSTRDNIAQTASNTATVTINP